VSSENVESLLIGVLCEPAEAWGRDLGSAGCHANRRSDARAAECCMAVSTFANGHVEPRGRAKPWHRWFASSVAAVV